MSVSKETARYIPLLLGLCLTLIMLLLSACVSIPVATKSPLCLHPQDVLTRDTAVQLDGLYTGGALYCEQ